MKHYCHYHSISPATWHCEACERYYDKRCVPDGDEKSGQATCPHCQLDMAYLEKRHNMPPYWQVRARFFRLPLAIESLFVIILNTFLAFSFHQHTLLALVTAGLSFILLSNYATRLSRNIARGGAVKGMSTQHTLYDENKHLPGITALFDFREIKDSLVLASVLALAFAPPSLLFYHTHTFAALTYLLFSTAILPAMLLMLLYAPPSSRHTLPPPSIADIISKMHLAYAGLVAYLLCFYLLVLISADLIQQYLPAFSHNALIVMLSSYLLIATFALFGYILRRYETFASQKPNKQNSQDPRLRDAKINFDADLDIAIKEGEYLQAINLLEEHIKKYGRSDLRVDQLYRLLLEHKDHKRLERFSHLILELLLGRGQHLAAYEFIELLRQHNAQYLIYDLALRSELAEVFYKMKEFALVLWLAKDAQTRFEDCDDLAKLYLRVAKTILGKSKTPEKARPYLAYVAKNYADSEHALAAQRLLEHLQQR